MRILQVTPCYLPGHRYGGPIASVHGLSRALCEAGHSVDVYTTNLDAGVPLDPDIPRTERIDGVNVKRFDVQFPRKLYRAPKMDEELRRRVASYDVVHVHTLYGWPTLAATRAAWRAGVPYVLSPRGMLVRELIKQRSRLSKTLWIRAVDRRSLEHANAIHATSEAECNDLREFGFDLPRIERIPNGVQQNSWDANLEALSPQVRRALAGKPPVLVLGRINWKKGLDLLLRAMQPHADMPLVVAGPDDGYGEAFDALVKELGMQNRVQRVGTVSGADKAALLTQAALLVMPSQHENFGNSVLEAMAVGTPAVVTEGVGVASIVAQSGGGRVVPYNAQALAASLVELCQDKQLRSALGAAGYRAVNKELSWAKVGKQFEHLYAALTTGLELRVPAA